MAEAGKPVAVISGAAGGIGEALVHGFLGVGYSVIGVDRSPSNVSAPDHRHIDLDITDTAAVATFGAGLERADVLINAAGIIRRSEEFNAQVFEMVLDVNLTGSMRLATACRPALARNGGSIINFASMYAFLGGGHAPAYSASKGGIVQLTKALAAAWAKDNIRVNALAPGWIATPLTEPVRADAARNRAILDRTALGRWGTPDDLFGPALFLASDAARFITGVVLPVDGGYLLT